MTITHTPTFVRANRLRVTDRIALPEGPRRVVYLYRPYRDTQSFITDDGIERKLPATHELPLIWRDPKFEDPHDG